MPYKPHCLPYRSSERRRGTSAKECLSLMDFLQYIPVLELLFFNLLTIDRCCHKKYSAGTFSVFRSILWHLLPFCPAALLPRGRQIERRRLSVYDSHEFFVQGAPSPAVYDYMYLLDLHPGNHGPVLPDRRTYCPWECFLYPRRRERAVFGDPIPLLPACSSEVYFCD